MTVTPITPVQYLLSQMTPLSNITPFTYRDGYTYVDRLEDLASRLNDFISTFNKVVDAVNLATSAIAALDSSVDSRIAAVKAQLEEEIALVRAELLADIVTASPSGMAFDPTTGQQAPTSEVISHVYDWLRVHAKFATQLDGTDATALELDTLTATARHQDLAATSTINDVYPNEPIV